MNKKEAKKLERDIELAYRKHGQGRQIDIMKIGALFADAKASVASGASVEDAVIAAIAKFCEPV